MDKKTWILCLSALAAFLLLTVSGVAFLYRGDGGPGSGRAADVSDEAAVKSAQASYPLLGAVPSDAALVMAFDDLRAAREILADSTKVFGALSSGMDRLLSIAGKGSCDGGDAVVSMHYSGSIVPLLILRSDARARQMRSADSTSSAATVVDTTSGMKALIAASRTLKMHSEIIDCGSIDGNAAPKGVLLLVSPSATLITASRRHLENGSSVLDRPYFAEAVVAASGKNSIMVSHDYASKLFGSFSRRPYTSYAPFFTRAARWTGLAVSRVSDRNTLLNGSMIAPAQENSAFVNVYSAPAGDARFSEIAPENTLFAVSQATSRISAFIETRKLWLDATGGMDKYRSRMASLKKSAGTDPEMWAMRLDVAEMAVAWIPSEGGTERIVLVRPRREDKELIVKGKGPQTNRFAGFASLLGGGIYPSDDTLAVWHNGWIVSGTERAVDAFAVSCDAHASLDGAGIVPVSKDLSASVYFSVGADPSIIDGLFSQGLAKAVRRTLQGVSAEYFTLRMKSGEISIQVERKDLTEIAASGTDIADIPLDIPDGPFKVKNSATGRTNLFSQSANGTLSLKEENGKGIWGVPFSGRLCGRVETIDYYANGKLQFLFASGDRLYLIDRLGRFVKPFPVSVGKPIVLGPDVYDFTGAHGYSVTVLHDDNTIGMYDLHGKTANGWKGIVSASKIISLPELLTVKNTKYWIVRTAEKSDIYAFDGGEALTGRLTGGRRLAPKGNVTVKDGTVSGECIDGKTRTIKL